MIAKFFLYWLPLSVGVILSLGSLLVLDPVFLILFALGAGVFIAYGWIVTKAAIASQANGRMRFTMRELLFVQFVVAWFLSVVVMHWPLQVGFILSKSSLDRMATEARDGKEIDEPQRAGLFLIRRTSVRSDGTVFLVVNPDPSGRDGFLWSDPPIDRPTNAWECISLDENWQAFFED